MAGSPMDTGGNWYGGAVGALGVGATGGDVLSELGKMTSEQRKRKKMKDAPSDQSLQMMPPATRDLLGGGGYGIS